MTLAPKLHAMFPKLRAQDPKLCTLGTTLCTPGPKLRTMDQKLRNIWKLWSAACRAALNQPTTQAVGMNMYINISTSPEGNGAQSLGILQLTYLLPLYPTE